jgi:hypothetical protein
MQLRGLDAVDCFLRSGVLPVRLRDSGQSSVGVACRVLVLAQWTEFGQIKIATASDFSG